MFKQRKLFSGKNVIPACGHCRFGSLSTGGSMILCEKFGVVSPSYSCKKYVYDPLKRVPAPPPKLEQFDEDDFKL